MEATITLKDVNDSLCVAIKKAIADNQIKIYRVMS